MRAISLHQPYATACFARAKDGEILKTVETRHWPTQVRGPLAIHAAKRWTREEAEDWPRFARFYRDWPEDPPLGAIIGVVQLVDCIPTERLVDQITAREAEWGNYGPKRFAWVLDHPRRLPQPMPCRGFQGFFDVPFDLPGTLL